MFRPMRRIKQQLSAEACRTVLEKRSAGVLAVHGDDGYPYAVPLSYVLHDDKILFHSAKSGHKLDGIKNNSKVSFCVIDQDDVVPEAYTTYYRSVIVFGNARILEQEAEIKEAIERLAAKYHPYDSKEHQNAMIEQGYAALCMVEVSISHMTGKEAIEIVHAKNNG